MASLFLWTGGQAVRAEELKNLLTNPGFEEIAPLVIGEPAFKDSLPGVTEMPKGWMINYSAYPGMLTVMYDPENSHGGMKYIRLEQTKKVMVALMGSAAPVKTGEKYLFSIWVKGKGRIALTVYTYNPKGFVGSIGGEWMDVSSAEWKEVKAELVIPEDRERIVSAVHVEGSVDCDDARLVPLKN